MHLIEGKLDEALIDRTVRRVFGTKFKLGLFDNQYPREEMIAEAYERKITSSQSLKATHEFIVLVNNWRIVKLWKNLLLKLRLPLRNENQLQKNHVPRLMNK